MEERRRVATFELEMLYEHTAHNSTQAYFTSILGTAEETLYENVEGNSDFRALLRKWMPLVEEYKERDVCVRCSFLYAPGTKDPIACPECGFERFEPQSLGGNVKDRKTHAVFRWWPLKNFFKTLFMTPNKAALVRSWKARLPADDVMVDTITTLYGVRYGPLIHRQYVGNCFYYVSILPQY